MEFLASIVTEVVRCLGASTVRRINYLVNYKTNIENLRNQLTNLDTRKKDILNKVEEAHRKLEEPTEEVCWWLEKANEIEATARNVGREENENGRWLKGLCPDWSSRYRTSEAAADNAKIVKEHQEKGNFSEVSRVLPPPSVIPIPSDYVEGLEPMMHAMDQLMEALHDKTIQAIGVHGMGGVGKTTLLKRLNNELQGNQLFEKVIFVTVSSNPNLERIQNDMAERLDLKFGKKLSLLSRANKLSMRLKQEKSVLIMLDDVWKRLDLFDVGIPSRTDHEGCKIVLSSRIESVCLQMGTERNIKLELLSDNESWILFKAKAGNVVDFPTLQPIAKLVMSECKGLPLSIVTVGLSLRMNGDVIIWRNALRKLQRSISNEQEDGVLSSFQLSYDFLKGADIKLCFLFCCLFPEDRSINWKYLFWYGVGEGFLKVDGNLEDALLEEVHVFVHRLKDCGLLLDGHENKEVKMHGVIRDVAIKISMDEMHGFLVKAGVGLEEWIECKSMEGYKRISLMNSNIRMVPAKPKCPNLRTLLLQHNINLKNIPDNFFKWMPSLLVLDLSYTGIRSLPPSLSCLTNLKTLCLQGCCNLQDVSLLGGLGKLEILCLNHCNICELPNELCGLTNLKLLDLTYTNRLYRIPSGLISKLTCLEVLDMRDSFSRWGAEENVGHGALAKFTELASLHRLTTLQVNFSDVECLYQNMSDGPWEKLNTFYIVMGDVSSYFRRYHETSSVLGNISLYMPSQNFASWITVLLKRAEVLSLRGCDDVNSIEELDGLLDLNCIEFLELEDCDQMECLVNFEKKVLEHAFANLKELYLSRLPKLEKLCHGTFPSQLGFGNLRVLQVYRCDKLGKALFSYNLLLGRMQNLEELEVRDCYELENVFHYDDNDNHDKEEGLSDQGLILPKLRKLWLINLPGLINILPIGSLHNLKDVMVRKCNRLKNVFTSRNFALGGLQQLHSLQVDDCTGMKELIITMAEDEKEVKQRVFFRLRELILWSLPELTCFYPRDLLFDFSSLEVIRILNCPKLKRLHLGPHSAPNLIQFYCSSIEWFQGLELDDESIRSKLQSRFVEYKLEEWS